MNDNKKTILTDIIGLIDINSSSGRNRLIYNFDGIDIAFQEYEEDFKDESSDFERYFKDFSYGFRLNRDCH